MSAGLGERNLAIHARPRAAMSGVLCASMRDESTSATIVGVGLESRMGLAGGLRAHA